MPLEITENKAANSINKMTAKRYSMPKIAAWVFTNYGVTTSRSSLCRIAKGERDASPELEKALVAAAKVLK